MPLLEKLSFRGSEKKQTLCQILSFKIAFLKYTDNLCLQTTLRVWDVLFYEGAKVLFHAALAIFKVLNSLPLISLLHNILLLTISLISRISRSFADERKRAAYDSSGRRCNQHITENLTPAL